MRPITLSDEQLNNRLNTVERLIAECRDAKSLPALNHTFQVLLDEQVRRDLEQQESRYGTMQDV